MYFLRNLQTKLPTPLDAEQARTTMPRFIEYGVLNQNSLIMLQQLMSNIFMPLLSVKTLSSAEETVQSKPNMLRDEFMLNMNKFVQQIRRTINQIEGRFGLDIPENIKELDNESEEKIAQNPEAVEMLENTVSNWQNQVLQSIEEQLKAERNAPGPLAEIEYWRERNASLIALLEQLKRPEVMKMLNILRLAKNPVVDNFDMAKSELKKYSIEARENVRFLSTLERHFKNLQHTNDFGIIYDTIPSMMNSLRMVWIISRHYNKDERMVPLMELIAWQLAERVSRNVNIKTIYNNSPQKVKQLSSDARKCLECWKSSYLEVRAKIEENERDARWEFDRKKLFDVTDYMASICKDIYEVAQVLEEFYNIFGPELKVCLIISKLSMLN